MNALTNRNKEVCNYLGVFGILVSLTCLIQSFIFGRSDLGLLIFTGVYVFSIIAYSLLAVLNAVSPILLIINAILVFVLAMLMIIGGVYSAIVIILMIYSIIVVVVIHVDGIPAKFRKNLIARRAEADAWRGKI